MTEPPRAGPFERTGSAHDYAALEWQPIGTYKHQGNFLALLVDAKQRMILGAMADDGEWCEYLDGELLSKDFIPVEWATPTSEMIQTLAFG